MATVLVIDASTSVRETLRIVLGHEHDVVVGASLDLSRPDESPDLVVLGLPAMPRDDRALGTTLARLAPGIPVLLLHAPSEVDVHALVPPHVPVDYLPKPFDAYGVRAHVRALLGARLFTAASTDLLHTQRRRLEPPFLPPPAAAILRRAITTDFPVLLLQGEPGTGARAIAHALHSMRGRGSFLALDVAQLQEGDLTRRIPAAMLGDLATIYLANIDLAMDSVQHDILEFMYSEMAKPAPSIRLVVGSRSDIGALASSGCFLPDLAYLVTTLPIVLTPLRERPEDIPAIVEMLTRDWCQRLRLDDVTYSSGALERLRQYFWFGNIAELEAVIARTIALHQPSVVEADQLIFIAEDTPRAMAARVSATTQPAVPGHSPTGPDLEVMLGELAHEFRNPMVTIKTFAQHLDSVLADPEVRARFAVLTADAINRMDGLIETLLEFSRFRAPALQPIDIQAILDRALEERAEDLARRHVTVERNDLTIGSVLGDEAQVSFALRSLWRGLIPDLVVHSQIKLSGSGGALEIRVRTEASIAARLAAWVEPRSNGTAAETPPMAWVLAAALLERNGATLRACRGDHDTTMIHVDWARQLK